MNRAKPSRALLAIAAVVACSAWPVAALLWFRFDERAFAISIALLGVSLGPCLALYGIAPRRRKQTFRKLVLAAGGLSILAFPLLARVDIDLEGFFTLLLLGSGGAAIGHTIITVIAGPTLFGRVLCGWGCWRSMVLEILPLGRAPRRRGRLWNALPYGGLAVSIAASATAVYFLGHRPGGAPGNMHGGSVAASATLVAIYYAAAIGLALALKDRRAFCKYLCPTSAILRLTSRVSVLAIVPDPASCDGCGACTRVCPMDIDVAALAKQGRPVRTGDCIVCQRCAHACPPGALRFGNRFRLSRGD